MERKFYKLTKRSIMSEIPVPPPKPLQLTDVPMWTLLPYDTKYPLYECSNVAATLSRGELGKSLYRTYPNQEFDLTHSPTPYPDTLTYDPLHDPQLRDFFKAHATRFESLVERGMVTEDGRVKSHVRDYNHYRMYLYHLWALQVNQLSRTQMSEEKHRFKGLFEAQASGDTFFEDVTGKYEKLHVEEILEEAAVKIIENKKIIAEHGFTPFVRATIQWKMYQEGLQKDFRNHYPAIKKWLDDCTKQYKKLMEMKLNAGRSRNKKLRSRWERICENSRARLEKELRMRELEKETMKTLSEQRYQRVKNLWTKTEQARSKLAPKESVEKPDLTEKSTGDTGVVSYETESLESLSPVSSGTSSAERGDGTSAILSEKLIEDLKDKTSPPKRVTSKVKIKITSKEKKEPFPPKKVVKEDVSVEESLKQMQFIYGLPDLEKAGVADLEIEDYSPVVESAKATDKEADKTVSKDDVDLLTIESATMIPGEKILDQQSKLMEFLYGSPVHDKIDIGDVAFEDFSPVIQSVSIAPDKEITKKGEEGTKTYLEEILFEHGYQKQEDIWKALEASLKDKKRECKTKYGLDDEKLKQHRDKTVWSKLCSSESYGSPAIRSLRKESFEEQPPTTIIADDGQKQVCISERESDADESKEEILERIFRKKPVRRQVDDIFIKRDYKVRKASESEEVQPESPIEIPVLKDKIRPEIKDTLKKNYFKPATYKNIKETLDAELDFFIYERKKEREDRVKTATETEPSIKFLDSELEQKNIPKLLRDSKDYTHCYPRSTDEKKVKGYRTDSEYESSETESKEEILKRVSRKKPQRDKTDYIKSDLYKYRRSTLEVEFSKRLPRTGLGYTTLAEKDSLQCSQTDETLEGDYTDNKEYSKLTPKNQYMSLDSPAFKENKLKYGRDFLSLSLKQNISRNKDTLHRDKDHKIAKGTAADIESLKDLSKIKTDKIEYTKRDKESLEALVDDIIQEVEIPKRKKRKSLLKGTKGISPKLVTETVHDTKQKRIQQTSDDATKEIIQEPANGPTKNIPEFSKQVEDVEPSTTAPESQEQEISYDYNNQEAYENSVKGSSNITEKDEKNEISKKILEVLSEIKEQLKQKNEKFTEDGTEFRKRDEKKEKFIKKSKEKPNAGTSELSERDKKDEIHKSAVEHPTSNTPYDSKRGFTKENCENSIDKSQRLIDDVISHGKLQFIQDSNEESFTDSSKFSENDHEDEISKPDKKYIDNDSIVNDYSIIIKIPIAAPDEEIPHEQATLYPFLHGSPKYEKRDETEMEIDDYSPVIESSTMTPGEESIAKTESAELDEAGKKDKKQNLEQIKEIPEFSQSDEENKIIERPTESHQCETLEIITDTEDKSSESHPEVSKRNPDGGIYIPYREFKTYHDIKVTLEQNLAEEDFEDSSDYNERDGEDVISKSSTAGPKFKSPHIFKDENSEEVSEESFEDNSDISEGDDEMSKSATESDKSELFSDPEEKDSNEIKEVFIDKKRGIDTNKIATEISVFSPFTENENITRDEDYADKKSKQMHFAHSLPDLAASNKTETKTPDYCAKNKNESKSPDEKSSTEFKLTEHKTDLKEYPQTDEKIPKFSDSCDKVSKTFFSSYEVYIPKKKIIQKTEERSIKDLSKISSKDADTIKKSIHESNEFEIHYDTDEKAVMENKDIFRDRPKFSERQEEEVYKTVLEVDEYTSVTETASITRVKDIVDEETKLIPFKYGLPEFKKAKKNVLKAGAQSKVIESGSMASDEETETEMQLTELEEASKTDSEESQKYFGNFPDLSRDNSDEVSKSFTESGKVGVPTEKEIFAKDSPKISKSFEDEISKSYVDSHKIEMLRGIKNEPKQEIEKESLKDGSQSHEQHKEKMNELTTETNKYNTQFDSKSKLNQGPNNKFVEEGPRHDKEIEMGKQTSECQNFTFGTENILHSLPEDHDRSLENECALVNAKSSNQFGHPVDDKELYEQRNEETVKTKNDFSSVRGGKNEIIPSNIKTFDTSDAGEQIQTTQRVPKKPQIIQSDISYGTNDSKQSSELSVKTTDYDEMTKLKSKDKIFGKPSNNTNIDKEALLRTQFMHHNSSRLEQEYEIIPNAFQIETDASLRDHSKSEKITHPKFSYFDLLQSSSSLESVRDLSLWNSVTHNQHKSHDMKDGNFYNIKSFLPSTFENIVIRSPRSDRTYYSNGEKTLKMETPDNSTEEGDLQGISAISHNGGNLNIDLNSISFNFRIPESLINAKESEKKIRERLNDCIFPILQGFLNKKSSGLICKVEISSLKDEGIAADVSKPGTSQTSSAPKLFSSPEKQNNSTFVDLDNNLNTYHIESGEKSCRNQTTISKIIHPFCKRNDKEFNRDHCPKRNTDTAITEEIKTFSNSPINERRDCFDSTSTSGEETLSEESIQITQSQVVLNTERTIELDSTDISEFKEVAVHPSDITCAQLNNEGIRKISSERVEGIEAYFKRNSTKPLTDAVRDNMENRIKIIEEKMSGLNFHEHAQDDD